MLALRRSSPLSVQNLLVVLELTDVELFAAEPPCLAVYTWSKGHNAHGGDCNCVFR
jgi:hypothetical protein